MSDITTRIMSTLRERPSGPSWIDIIKAWVESYRRRRAWSA